MAENTPTGAAARTDDPVTDLRVAIGQYRPGETRAGNRLQSAAACLLSALIPARDRLRVALDAASALPSDGFDQHTEWVDLRNEAANMMLVLGNAQQPSEVPSPDRVPGVGEARDNLQTAIVNFNGRGGTRDGAERALKMRDAALDLLHALRQPAARIMLAGPPFPPIEIPDLRYGPDDIGGLPAPAPFNPALNDLAIAVVAYEGARDHPIADPDPAGQDLLDAAKLVLSSRKYKLESGEDFDPANRPIGWPWVCLGPAPRAAWSISGDMDWAQEIQFWDLWQVELSPSDDIRLRNDSGQRIIEIRVHNTIPPDRVWWVGEREPWVVEEES